MSVLQTIDLKKYYGTEPNITRALDGVNFSVEDGEFVAVVGTSGSGKSTLLHMMGGLDTPTSGTVIVRGEELAKKNDEQLTIFRRRNIGFIFQNYNLVPILNVYENIVLPVELDGDTVDQKFLDEIVHLLGLEDKLKNMPNNLSGGQQQRVAIARALITKPAIVLADEPTGNLDSKTSAEVLGLIKRTSAEFRQTVVMIPALLALQTFLCQLLCNGAGIILKRPCHSLPPPYSTIFPILNVYENIVLPVELDGDTVDQKILDEIVHLLGLEDKLKNMPNNLSGGQQQRVAIARALITKPAIVLADEPTGNLDSKTSAEVLGLIKRTSAEFRQTVVMITHNDDIARLADRIVRIEDGRIVE